MAVLRSSLSMEWAAPLDAVVPSLPEAAEPIVLPVPSGAVKVLPRWADEDGVIRWRLKYRPLHPDEKNPASQQLSSSAPVDTNKDDGFAWIELELRPFTRELPLSGMEYGILHLFKVAIETPHGWSSWSRTVYCTPPSPEVPGKCAAVFALVKDDHTALVRWTRPIDYAAAVSCGGILRYRVLVSWPHGSDLAHKEVVVENGDSESCEVPDLECQRDFRFQVSAQNVSGWGEYSDPSPVLNMPPPVPPTLPQPTLRRAQHHSAVIQWQHPRVNDVPLESFRFRYTASDDWKNDVTEIHDVPPTLAQFVVEGLLSGTTYHFQVVALNRYGMGIWSESSIPIRTLDGYAPSKIEGLSVPNLYKSFITLRWPCAQENGFQATSHRLRFAHDAGMTDPVEIEPAVTRKDGMDSCDLRHLKKTVYYFQVAAINEMGMSEWSDPFFLDLSETPRLEDA